MFSNSLPTTPEAVQKGLPTGTRHFDFGCRVPSSGNQSFRPAWSSIRRLLWWFGALTAMLKPVLKAWGGYTALRMLLVVTAQGRSAERRVGTEWDRTSSSRGSPQ